MNQRNRKLCVAIANDVLAQLRMKRYEATSGVYVNVRDDSLLNMSWAEMYTISFKTFFKKQKTATCQVCALGAAFVSLVNIKNKCSIQDVMHERDMDIRLEELFGADNMTFMESAFERVAMAAEGHNVSPQMQRQTIQWGFQWSDPTERLRNIMLNIVRNNGDFKLPQKYVAAAKRAEQAKSSGSQVVKASS